jgi:YihY family inner membrane protein
MNATSHEATSPPSIRHERWMRALTALPRFGLDVLRSFRANQGVLLAGAVAYYTLLSLIPVLILMLIGLAQFIDESRLLQTVGEYLEFLIPGQAIAIVGQLQTVLAHRELVGGVLLLTMLFFSSLAFTVLENAMAVIFHHRLGSHRRPFLVSVLLPYVFILCLGVGLLIATVVSGKLVVLASRDVTLLGQMHSLERLSDYLLYLVGVLGEILVLTAIYLVMPVGTVSWRHALLGGVTAALLWEVTRHVLVWYYATLSQVTVVYGAFAAAITILLSVEVAAIFLLLGAQVISCYERERRGETAAVVPLV